MSGQGKRVGIVTHYYKSRNFGGLLQAYALCRALRELGFEAEQICYGHIFETPPVPCLRDRLRGRPIADIALSLRRRTANRLLKGRFEAQAAAMYGFGREEIPHSEKVYMQDDIRTCRGYDVYITGSDQVWNPEWYTPAFFLEFVPERARKVAYAASIGHSALSAAEAEWFRKELEGFSAVSVRESDAAELLSPVSPVPVEWVLDPTLLLPRGQWDEICADRIVQGPYLFCYFLGTGKRSRRLAERFAKKRGLKVVSILHVHGTFRGCDMRFGDERLSGVSPKGFLSLIKYADYVFTDSFHAVVFSEIYGKGYAVFRRSAEDSMTSRIYSVTTLFGSQERFCDTEEKESLEYIEALPPAGAKEPCPLLESMRQRSYEFLERAL